MPAHANFDGDVAAIRACLTRLVEEEEKEVVLVTHSYSGLPGGEAPRGLGLKERKEKGLKGGVKRLVFAMAFIAPEGFCPLSGGVEFPTWINVDATQGTATVSPADAKDIFYHDLPAAEAETWASKLVPQSIGVFTSTTTYAAWQHISSTFVLASLDRSAMSKEAVHAMIKAAQAVEPSACDVVEEVEAGHCFMVSKAEWFAGVLGKAAGEGL